MTRDFLRRQDTNSQTIFMKKRIFLVIACLFILSFAPANAQSPAATGLLWRVSGKGLSKPSFVFGTAHIICTDDYIWTDKMSSALKSCEVLCLEMNLDNPAEMQKVMAGMADATGKKLDAYFSIEQYTRLQNFFSDTLHLPITMFEAMKPTALLGVLEQYGANCGTAAESYEMNLIKKAKENGQKISGFETAEEMLALLDRIPDDTVVKATLAMISDFSENRAYNRRIIDAYRAGDVNTIYDLVHNSGGLGSNEAYLIDNRNKNWLGIMKTQMPQSATFYAVGAGHLGGNNGLIALLRSAGYTVTPVL